MKSNIKALSMMMVISLMLIAAASASAVNRVTINDIRDEVKEGWHQTYEAHGRTIVVNIEIDIPDVSTVPVIRVGFPPPLTPNDDSGETYLRKDGIGRVVESKPGVYRGNGGFYPIIGPDARAENSSLSLEEAWEFFDELIRFYADQIGLMDFIRGTEIIRSRSYERAGRTGGLTDLNLDAPTSEMGNYGLAFYQVFHGIPYINIGHYTSPAFPNHLQMDLPYPYISTMLASKSEYTLSFCPAVEVAVLADDIPLVPFADVKKAYENLIKVGHIREVFDVRLSYYMYVDRNYPGEFFVLMPVWVLRGSIAEKASFPDPQPDQNMEEYYYKYLGQSAIVEAFTGQLLGDRPEFVYADPSHWK